MSYTHHKTYRPVKIRNLKTYIGDDGIEIKTGLVLLGILRKSRKHLEHNCEICRKEIGKEADYVILNDPSPYYWHVKCLLEESPNFEVIYKTTSVVQGYFRHMRLYVGSLKDHLRSEAMTNEAKLKSKPL